MTFFFSFLYRNVNGIDIKSIEQNKKEDEREKYWAKHVRMEMSDYARQRALRYPNIGDQLDDLFKQGLFSDEMSAKIQAVKDDIPKPNE